jgi:hypothetical protein
MALILSVSNASMSNINGAALVEPVVSAKDADPAVPRQLIAGLLQGEGAVPSLFAERRRPFDVAFKVWIRIK